jgi:hypothetical protein
LAAVPFGDGVERKHAVLPVPGNGAFPGRV